MIVDRTEIDTFARERLDICTFNAAASISITFCSVKLTVVSPCKKQVSQS